MATKSYAEQISGAQVMVAGLNGHASEVNRRGLDETFVNKMDADQKSATELNNQQEKLKADLKLKTAELEAKLAELGKSVSEAKKVVKLEFPKDQWKEFGMDDKR
jgi:hypothetical protein